MICGGIRRHWWHSPPIDLLRTRTYIFRGFWTLGGTPPAKRVVSTHENSHTVHPMHRGNLCTAFTVWPHFCTRPPRHRGR